MDSGFYFSQQDADHIYYEKLFTIINHLHSICEQAKVLPNSEQFVSGVETSIEVVRSAITGNLYKNTMSILGPNQIPLF